MNFTSKTTCLLPALGLFCAVGAAPALAQMSSSASEAAGATTGLGTSHRFAATAAASAHCPGDTVIWSAGGMKYVAPGAPGYGSGKGFYACKAEADDAGFQPK